MKTVRLILGVLVAIAILTFVVETLESFVVTFLSGQTIEYFSKNQTEYFTIRNQSWILVLKAIYTFLSALIAGWAGSVITRYLLNSFFIILIVVQGAAFLYAILLSEFKNTLPLSYWILLVILVFSGIYVGSRRHLH